MQMKVFVGFVLSCLLLTIASADEGLRETKIGDLLMSVPSHWKPQPPANRLRMAQFEIPGTDDGRGAELSIFNFGAGGGPAQQIDRWKGQFLAKDRKFKATQGQTHQGSYIFVELSGTYKMPVGPLIERRTEPAPESRMMMVMLAIEGKGNYFLKLVGSDDVVKANAQAFRSSFGADADKEKAYEG